MLILKPEVHETIWGGEKLTPFSGSTCKKIGHLYSAYCHANGTNIILNGAWRGKTMSQYFDENKARFHLGDCEYFPLIIALVEAADNLSIQVHPDDETAPVLDPAIRRGKNESWFFIDAPEDGAIYNGCLCSNLEELRRSIISGNIEQVTDRLPVKKGDYVYVKAGTLHSMSKGSLVYEIEENAGCTYRFYDFNRIDKNGKSRPLQIPEAFFSIKPENKSEAKRYDGAMEEKRYITWHYEGLTRYRNESDTLQASTVLSGGATVDGVEVITGMTVILEPGEEADFEGSEVMIAQPK